MRSLVFRAESQVARRLPRHGDPSAGEIVVVGFRIKRPVQAGPERTEPDSEIGQPAPMLICRWAPSSQAGRRGFPIIRSPQTRYSVT